MRRALRVILLEMPTFSELHGVRERIRIGKRSLSPQAAFPGGSFMKPKVLGNGQLVLETSKWCQGSFRAADNHVQSKQVF